MPYTTFHVSNFYASMLVRSRRNAASAQVRFLVCPSFAQGDGGTAHRQSSAEKTRDQGKPRNQIM